MKTIYFASVCAVTIFSVISFANAQGTNTTSNSDQGVTSKQCWDVSKNIIREKDSTTAGAPPSPKTTNTVGSTMTGEKSYGASSSDTTGNASARPVGMPDC